MGTHGRGFFAGTRTALPVELAAFTGAADGRNARFAWTTASEINNAGFFLERLDGSLWTPASDLIAGHGTTTERHDYAHTVENLPSGRHTFRLRQVGIDGAMDFSQAVTVEIAPENGFELTLRGTRVSVSVAEPQRVVVSLYSLLGQRVAVLHQGDVTGSVEAVLPGDLAVGLYVVRADGETARKTLRVFVR